MLMSWTRPRILVRCVGFMGFAITGASVLILLAHPKPTGASVAISQRNRQFTPGAVTIRAGDAVTIVNDDGDLHHHAYVSSPDFKFDSGDQAPRSRTDIVFPMPGQFTVLCGIHPKMHLAVTVR